jgi:hypothetical protein
VCWTNFPTTPVRRPGSVESPALPPACGTAGGFLISIAFGLTCLGCLLLSLSLRRHYRQVFSDESAYQRRMWRMRLAGYACLLLALWPCVRDFGAPIGICLWLSIVALAAFAQIMLLTYRPRTTTAFGAFGVALILAGVLW